MKVQEFIEAYKKNNGMKSTKSLIGTKNYLPYIKKKELVDSILDKCKRVNNGFVQFDEMEKYIVFTLEIISAYTNIEFDEDFSVSINEYDALCEVNALNSIIETFEGEYNAVLSMLSMRQDYILQANSIEYQVAQFLTGLSDKLDSVIESISGKFDAYKDLDITADDIDKLTSFIGTLGK